MIMLQGHYFKLTVAAVQLFKLLTQFSLLTSASTAVSAWYMYSIFAP